MKISMKKQSNLTLNEGFERFIQKCEVKNLSPKTIVYYEVEFKRFINYISGETLLENIDSECIEQYVIYLKKNSNANDVTIATYVRAIRAIFYYLMKMGYMESFPITIPKAIKKVKETYTDNELEILLKKPNINKCTFTEYKTWVYINYLLATGNRISTAINLQVKDLDFDNLLIRLRTTKNKKEQYIPMAVSLRTVLLEYLDIRGNDKENYVFCTQTGEQATVRTYEDNLKYYNRKRGVTKISSHLFRHTYAKNWILQNGDVFRLQKMLGHSDLTVVREYVNMFSNDLMIDFEKFNLLDKFQKPTQTIKIK